MTSAVRSIATEPDRLNLAWPEQLTQNFQVHTLAPTPPLGTVMDWPLVEAFDAAKSG
jgi:hypothetical protein